MASIGQDKHKIVKASKSLDLKSIKKMVIQIFSSDLETGLGLLFAICCHKQKITTNINSYLSYKFILVIIGKWINTQKRKIYT